MERVYDSDLALAHYRLADLYSESNRYRQIKEAKQNRPSWFNRWAKQKQSKNQVSLITN